MRRAHEPIIWVVPDAVKAGVVVRARPRARTTLLNSPLQVVFSCPPRQFDITDCNVGSLTLWQNVENTKNPTKRNTNTNIKRKTTN